MSDWIVSRLSERSTYAGLIAMLSLVGNKTIDGDLANAITTVGMAVAGLFAVIMRETGHA